MIENMPFMLSLKTRMGTTLKAGKQYDSVGLRLLLSIKMMP
ncbi:hypothetical protein [Bartonella sp. AP58NXGY]